MKKTIKFLFCIPEDMYQKIEQTAEAMYMTKSEYIRRSIAKNLKNKD